MTIPLLAALATMMLLGSRGGPTPRHVELPVEAEGEPIDRAARRRRSRTGIAAALLVTSAIVIGPFLTVAITLTIGCWPRCRHLLAARATRRSIDAALPDAIELLVLVTHAGMTPHQAIVVLGERAPKPIQPAFAEVRHRIARGTPLADAIHALPELLGPAATVVADTLSMAERHGTPIAQTLEQLARDVRERRRRIAEADARKLPIRMSFPLVVCILPAFVLIAIVPAVLAAMASLGDSGL
jgi:tight adherence protein C